MTRQIILWDDGISRRVWYYRRKFVRALPQPVAGDKTSSTNQK
jgi:hypothetical protein